MALKSAFKQNLNHMHQALVEPISASLHPGNTVPFEEILQRWRAVGNTVSNLIGPRFELPTPVGWSSSNASVSGAEDLRFKSWAGQIEQSVANGSPPLQHFFERRCVARAQ